MALPIEDYALIGDHAHRGAGRPRRIDRLALPAALRLGRVLRGAARDEDNGTWRIAPADEGDRDTRRYRAGTLVLETDFQTAEGAFG